MKKGCFLSSITILTILIMLGIYFYRNNKVFLKQFGKEKLIGFLSNKVEDEISKLKDNSFKDSIKVLFKKELTGFKESGFNRDLNNFGAIVDRLEKYSNDHIIDSTEYAKLKIMVASDEESKKN